MQDGRPLVGVFDSGVGGLTVLRACFDALPAADYIYFGDNAHAPYGGKSREEIRARVKVAFDIFSALGVDGALIACNTATAACVQEARRKVNFPVVGMEPAVLPAAAHAGRVLVLATPFTAASARLRELVARAKGGNVTVAALPRLAGEIEGALTGGKGLTLSDHLPAICCDGVVLGCTHYAYFRREIAKFYGAEVFDGAEGTARRLASLIFAPKSGTADHRFGMADHHKCEQNPNKCFTKKYTKWAENRIFFLGEGGEVNERVFKTNICFKNI